MKEGRKYTEDAIFNGKVLVCQRFDGYRFSLDALLLAWYASALPGNRALELGAGSGVVSLALAHKRPALAIDAVEIQESLASLARENVKNNGLSSVNVHLEDIRSLSGPKWDGGFDLVFSNPPYRALGRGRLNPDREKAQARHELLGNLDDFVACASRCLRSSGSAAFVLLADRESDLAAAAANNALGILHRCWVRPYPEKPPNLLLVLLQPEDSSGFNDDELIVYSERGRYKQELKAILEGEWERIAHPLAFLSENPVQNE